MSWYPGLSTLIFKPKTLISGQIIERSMVQQAPGQRPPQVGSRPHDSTLLGRMGGRSAAMAVWQVRPHTAMRRLVFNMLTRPCILARWAKELASKLAAASLEDPEACCACQAVAVADDAQLVTRGSSAWRGISARVFFFRLVSARGLAQLQLHFSCYAGLQAAVHRQALAA